MALRLLGIEINLDYLIDIVRTGHETHPRAICVDGVPDTAKFEFTMTNDVQRKFVIVFSDESFPELVSGQPIPRKNATMLALDFDKKEKPE